MTSQYFYPNPSKSSSGTSWISYQYNDLQMEGPSAIDFSNGIIPGENSLRPYPSCSANRQTLLLPETNHFETSYPETLDPTFQVNHNYLALQDVHSDMYLNASFQETDSSCESPSFESQAYNSLALDLIHNRYNLLISPSLEATNVPTEYSFNNSLGKKGQIKKHKRRHIMNRSKLGCWICRIKHLKCDEIKPTCANCLRFGIQCDYSQKRPAYVLDRRLRRQKLDAIITKKRRRPINNMSVVKEPNVPLDNSEQIDYSYFSKNDWVVFLDGQSVT